MGKKKVKTMTILQLADYDADRLAVEHLHWVVDSNKVYKENLRKPQLSTIYETYTALVHIIISYSQRNRNACCYLNAVKYTEILGRHFGRMLAFLSFKSIVSIGNYEVGAHSRTITLLDWNIREVEIKNIKIIDRIIKILEYENEKMQAKADDIPDEPFFEHYNKCLSQLTLRDRAGALKYVNEHFDRSSGHKYYYYLHCVNSFQNNPQITSVDKNNRIYHYLTNTPRVIRPFFNIKLDVDISNCHPLLFTHYLGLEYNIDINILRNISYLPYIPHYDCKELRKSLKDKLLGVPLVKDLPNDVFEYIYITQHGKFYERFIDIFENIGRGELKRNVFRDVFYSHSRTTYGSEFRKQFKVAFPNVWKLVVKMRKQLEVTKTIEKIIVGRFQVPVFTKDWDKPLDNLANEMMKLESSLMRDTLETCWTFGWTVINIHDALLMLDTDNNKGVTVEGLEFVVKDVFAKRGLFPCLSVENAS